MTATLLTLFDLTTLNPTTDCQWCGNRPATTRVAATRNLYGVIPTWLAATWYRDATHTARSGPACDQCAWNLASVWWGSWRVCPSGTCDLWAHTLADQLPHQPCTRHHDETTVIWLTPLEVTS